MALTNSWPGVNAAATTTDARKDLAGLIETDSTGAARAGVFPSHTNALVSARTDMNLDIGIFQAAAVQFGGPVLLANDAVAQLPSPLVSPGAGTNFYVVYAKQNESTAPGTDANNNKVLGTVLSTTSFALARSGGTRMDASGTGLPTGAIELATVQMPTAKTATNQSGVVITQTYQFTAAEGGVVVVRNATELAAWTPADGALAYNLATQCRHRRVGGAWVRDSDNLVTPGAVTGGTIGADGATVSFSGVGSVSFDSIFTNSPEDYLVVLEVDSQTAGAYHRMRLRAAGTDISSASYAEFSQIDRSLTLTTGTTDKEYSLQKTSFLICYSDSSSLGRASADVRISGPARTGHSWTPMRAHGVGQDRGVFTSGGARVGTICDGFTIFVDSGTFSGRVRVYALPGV
jgi:hypothetical protein